MRAVIIGAGIAGTTCAEELRKKMPDAEIVLIGEEFQPLYSRVLLPHFVKGKVPREKVFIKKAEWYAEQKIEWLYGISVEDVDTTNKHVAISDGREIPYDVLVITTGTEIRSWHTDDEALFYLQTIEDADYLHAQLATAQKNAAGFVYGGGFIACEFINIFAHAGMPINVAHRGAHFWNTMLHEEAGALIAAHLKKQGVQADANVQDFTMHHEEGRLHSVQYNGTERPATMIGIGIGGERLVGWIARAGIEIGRGVKTNAFLETNVPGVYAAGDIAEWMDVKVGRARTVGIWMNAVMQGRSVAHAIAGEKKPFELVTSYSTDVLGLNIVFIGDTELATAEHVEFKANTENGSGIQYYFRSGMLVGAALIGCPTERAVLTKQIGTHFLI